MVLFRKRSGVCILSSGHLFHKALSSPIRLFQLTFKADGRCIIRSYITESVSSSRVLYKPASILFSSSVGSACKWLCSSSTYAPQILLYISKPVLLALQSTLNPSAKAWLLETVEKSLFQMHLTQWPTPVSVFISDIYTTIHPVLCKITSVVFAVLKDGDMIIPFQDNLTYIDLFQRIVFSLGNVISKIQTFLFAGSSSENAWMERLLYKWLTVCKSVSSLLIRSLATGKPVINILEDFINELHLDPRLEIFFLTLATCTHVLICKQGPIVLNFICAVSPRIWKLFRTVIPIVTTIICRLSNLFFKKTRQFLPHLSKCMAEAVCASVLSAIVQAGIVLQSSGKVLLPMIYEISTILYTNLCIVYPELLTLARICAPQVWFLLKGTWPTLSKGACYTFEHLCEIWPHVWCFVCVNVNELQRAAVSSYPHVCTSAKMAIASVRVIVAGVNCLFLTCCPIMGTTIHKVAQCFCGVICTLVPLLYAASHEVAPVLLEEVVHVLCSAFCRVAPSLISAAREVTPVLCRAELEVMWAAWFAICEVCPVLYTAAVEVSPVVNQAFWTVAPVAYIALSVVAATLWKACKEEVVPKTWCATCVVAPHLWKAFCAMNAAAQQGGIELYFVTQKTAREISCVLASAGVEVAKVTQTVVMEVCQVSDITLEEVASTWQNAFQETRGTAVTFRSHCLDSCYSKSGVFAFTRRTNFYYCLRSLHILSFDKGIYLSWLSRKMQQNAVAILHLLGVLSQQGKKPVAALIYISLSFFHKCATILLNSTKFALKQTANSITSCIYHSVTVSLMCSISFSLLFHVLELSLSAEYRLCLFLSSAYQHANIDIQSLLQQLILKLGPPFGRLMFRSSLKVWKWFCLFVSKCWDVTEKYSPHVWSVICEVSPVIFQAVCSLNRTAWIAVCNVSPQLWQLMCICCPHLWTVLCLITPPIWSSTCKAVSLFWFEFCEICPFIWAILCSDCTVLWNAFLKINAFLWKSFCLSGARLWDVMCTVTAVTWHSSCCGVAAVWNCSCPAVFLSWSTSNWTIITIWSCFRITWPLAVKLVYRAGSSVQMAVICASWSKTLVCNAEDLFSWSDFLTAGTTSVKKVCFESSVVSLVFTTQCADLPRQPFPFPIFHAPFHMALKALSFICKVMRSETRTLCSGGYSRVLNFLPRPNLFVKRLPSFKKISHKLSTVCSKPLFILNGM